MLMDGESSLLAAGLLNAQKWRLFERSLLKTKLTALLSSLRE